MLRSPWLRLVLIGVAVYVGFCLLMTLAMERFVFPARGQARAVGARPPAEAEVWKLDAAPGVSVEAWFFPGRGRSASSSGPAVVCFHGNGELIDDNVDTAQAFVRRGVSVLLVEYRGYGRSGGEPDIAGIRADGVKLYDLLAARPEVRRDRIVAHGFSLGSAFAAQLAAVRPIRGLLLEAPFSSLPSMARGSGVYLYLPRERLDTVAVMRALPPEVVVFITHGLDDRAIRPEEGAQVAAARPGAVHREGVYGHQAFAIEEKSGEFLERFLKAAFPAD